MNNIYYFSHKSSSFLKKTVQIKIIFLVWFGFCVMFSQLKELRMVCIVLLRVLLISDSGFYFIINTKTMQI